MRNIEVHTLVRITDSDKAKPEGFRIKAEYALSTELKSDVLASATRSEIERMVTESSAMAFLELDTRYPA